MYYNTKYPNFNNMMTYFRKIWSIIHVLAIRNPKNIIKLKTASTVCRHTECIHHKNAKPLSQTPGLRHFLYAVLAVSSFFLASIVSVTMPIRLVMIVMISKAKET